MPTTHSATQMGNDLYRCALSGPVVQDGPTAEFAIVFRGRDENGNVGYSDSALVRDPDAPGQNYCEPSDNSTGAPGRIVARGSDLLAAQDLALEAWSLPSNSFGIFVASRTRGAMPLSQGTLCLGAPFVRFAQSILNSGATGSVALDVPFTALPPGVSFAAGETWNFTYWFRDVSPPASANLTDAVEVVWR